MEEFNPLEAIGSSGLRHYDGEINEDSLESLSGRRKIALYDEMRNDSTAIAASLHTMTILISQVKWRFEPANDSKEALEESIDCSNAINDMSHSFGDLISEALSMLWAGYAPMEITYKLRRGPDNKDSSLRSKYSDGKYGWRKVQIRSQDSVERWILDPDGGLSGMVQCNSDYKMVTIPIEKILLFRMGTFKNNPEGRSLLRPAIKPHYYAKRIE